MSAETKPATGPKSDPIVQWLPISPWAVALHKPVFALFLAAYVLALWVTVRHHQLSAKWHWTEPGFIILAAVTSLVGLARRLPMQNVVGAVCFLVFFTVSLGCSSTQTGIPFGTCRFTTLLGAKLFGLLPWTIPLVWITVILTSRGVARLILRPNRTTPNYGFWVIGLTGLLAVLLDLGLEPFAVRAKQYWLWQHSPNALNWYEAPLVNFIGLFASTIFIMIFITPWLISKQPVKHPGEYHPAIVWVLLSLLFTISNAAYHLWPAALAGGLISVAVSLLTLRGARRVI